MSLWLVLLVTVAYAYTSIEQSLQGNYPVGLMFFGYALANLGVMGVLK